MRKELKSYVDKRVQVANESEWFTIKTREMQRLIGFRSALKILDASNDEIEYVTEKIDKIHEEVRLD